MLVFCMQLWTVRLQKCIGSLSIRDSISRTIEGSSILPTQDSHGCYDLGSEETVRALLTHSDNDPIQSAVPCALCLTQAERTLWQDKGREPARLFSYWPSPRARCACPTTA